MMTRIWAALERIIPRGLLAGSTIAAAFVTSPYAIGLYTWAALALTLFAALTDSPVQHVAMTSIGTSAGRSFLRKYTYLSAVIGVLFMTLAVWMISEFAGQDSNLAIFISLSPFLLVPIARAIATRKTALLQLTGSWRKVMLFRFYGSITGAAIGLPIVFMRKSIFGACLTLAIAEIAYATLASLAAARIQFDLGHARYSTSICDEANGRPEIIQATYRHMVMFSTLGWLSGQIERVLLGSWAGTSALGIYSFGTAIGRSAGEAIASSQPGVLRAELTKSAARENQEIRPFLRTNLRGGLYLTAANTFAVIIISVLVLPRFLGEQWNSALQMAPILALSGIPSAVAQSTAPVFVQQRRAHLSYIAPAVLLFFAPLVALIAMKSLTLAAWAVLVREFMLATTQTLLLGRATPWREVFLAFTVTAAGAVVVAVL